MSKEHVEELKRARKLIATMGADYICHALSASPYGIAIKKQLRADMDADGFFGSAFETWLDGKCGIKFMPFSGEYKRKVIATRLAWIDAMIEYWKDKP